MNITFKTIFEYFLEKLVLCIQISFVSTEKTTRIASRASCYISTYNKAAVDYEQYNVQDGGLKSNVHIY